MSFSRNDIEYWMLSHQLTPSMGQIFRSLSKISSVSVFLSIQASSWLRDDNILYSLSICIYLFLHIYGCMNPAISLRFKWNSLRMCGVCMCMGRMFHYFFFDQFLPLSHILILSFFSLSLQQINSYRILYLSPLGKVPKCSLSGLVNSFVCLYCQNRMSVCIPNRRWFFVIAPVIVVDTVAINTFDFRTSLVDHLLFFFRTLLPAELLWAYSIRTFANLYWTISFIFRMYIHDAMR